MHALLGPTRLGSARLCAALTQTCFSRQIFKGFATSSNYNNVLQRCADRWCFTSAWNLYSGVVAAWGETHAVAHNPAECHISGETTNRMAQFILDYHLRGHLEMSFEEIQTLEHMGHRYVEKETWVVAQSRADFLDRKPPQLGLVRSICSANEDMFIEIAFYPSYIVSKQWDAGNLKVSEEEIHQLHLSGGVHQIIFPLHMVTMTPLRIVETTGNMPKRVFTMQPVR